MSEVLSIFTATMLGFMILEPVHLLWINLLTDCFPALALGMERAEPDIMSRPPRSARESIFAHGVGFDCVYQGVMCAILTLAAFSSAITWSTASGRSQIRPTARPWRF